MTQNNAIKILETRTKRLPNWAYKLSPSEHYGMDIAFSDKLDIDEGAMSVWIPFADGNRRDGVGDLLEVTGINTERHRQNPIVLFDHGKQVTLPVALAEDRNTKAYTVVIDPVARSAKANAFFYQGKGLQGVEGEKEYDHALFCHQLFDLIVKGYVRAGSIGYQVINAREMPPDFERGTPKGLHLLSVKMLEVSAVVLPANGDTVRKALSLPAVCGKPLSPMLVKSLSPYLPKQKRLVTGYRKDLLPGGVGDDASDARFDAEQLRIGIQHELEHTNNQQVAEEIAKDHLTEDPDYYRKLGAIEKAFPSDKIRPEKACQILKDGTANGQPITDKQRRMFGAACGNKEMGEVAEKGRIDEQPMYDREEHLRRAYNRGGERENQVNLTDAEIRQRTTPPAKKPGLANRAGQAVGDTISHVGRTVGDFVSGVIRGRKKELPTLKSIRMNYRKKSNPPQQQQQVPQQPGVIKRNLGRAAKVAGVAAMGAAGYLGARAIGNRRKQSGDSTSVYTPTVITPESTPQKSLKSIRAAYRNKDMRKVARTVGGAIGGLTGLGLSHTTMSGAAGAASTGLALGTRAGDYLGEKVERAVNAIRNRRNQSSSKSQFAGDLNWLKEEQEEVEHKQPVLKAIRMRYRNKRIGS